MQYSLITKARTGQKEEVRVLSISALYNFLKRKQLCIFDNMNLFEIEKGIGYARPSEGLRLANITKREYCYLVPKRQLTGRETIEEFEAKIEYEIIRIK